MATVPLAAAQIRPPEDPMVMVQRAMMLKSMLFGQQLSAANLQEKQLTAQQTALQLDGLQRLRAAQNDPSWDPTDTDAAVKLMNAHQVPLEVSGKVISAIGQIRQGLQQQSTENLSNAKGALDFWDDQLQAVKNAKPDQRQSAYESALENARNHANLLPDGPGKALYLANVAAAPPIVDLSWINQKHLETRTMQQLYDEAHVNAQTREAAGKGAQSEAEAANLRAKSDPSSPLFDPTAAATAIGAQGGTPWATAATKGEAAAAGAKAGAEAAARFPYEKQLETIRQQVSVQMSTNKDARDKIETTVLTPYEERMTEISQLQSAISQADEGNVAAARAALFKMVGIAQPEKTHRISPSEVKGFASMGGISDRIAGSVSDILSGDPWTDDRSADIKSFADAQARTARGSLNRGIGDVNKLYGTYVASGLVQTVRMRAPNGQEKDVDPADVEHYKAAGAEVVTHPKASQAPHP